MSRERGIVDAKDAEIAELRAEFALLKDALWKACGDDEQTVNSYIESQRPITTPPEDVAPLNLFKGLFARAAAAVSDPADKKALQELSDSIQPTHPKEPT